MRRLTLILALLAVLCTEARSAAEVIVLVVRSDSPVRDMDSLTVRKAFLGLPVLVNGSLLRPVRNRSQERLDEIFLQYIVAMSQPSYDRQILIGVNRQGWLRPSEAGTLDKVLEQLYADPNAISFVWERDAIHNGRLRIVRVLWSD